MPKSSSVQEFIASLDRMPPREEIRAGITRVIESVADFYGFERIGMPLLEDPAAFVPLVKAGMLEERSPLFQKDVKGEEHMLSPSASLSVLRAYASHKMSELPHPLKFMFSGDRFWKESEESGIRGVSEWGLIIIGEERVSAEAEIIHVFWRGLEEAGAMEEGMEIRINALGCDRCRPLFRSSFTSYFRARFLRLCKRCKRFLRSSPTMILRCAEERCRILAGHAPQILDFLCEVCKKHLKVILEFLDEMRVPYILDPVFFREGSWFTTVVFEIVLGAGASPKDIEEEAVVAARAEGKSRDMILGEGGRLSKAGELIVGRRLNVVAGAIFLGEIEAIARKKNVSSGERSAPAAFLVELGDAAKKRSLGILEMLRRADIPTRTFLGRDSIKTQLKIVEREGAAITLILGQKEVLDGTILVRETESGMQETVPQDKLAEFLRKRLKR